MDERMFWNPNTGMLWQFPCNYRGVYYCVLWLTLKDLAPQGFLNPHLINDYIIQRLFDNLSLTYYCPYILLDFLQNEHETSISIITHEPRNLDLVLPNLYQNPGSVFLKVHSSAPCKIQPKSFSIQPLGLPSFLQEPPDKTEIAKLYF